MISYIPTRLNQHLLNGIVGGFNKQTAKFIIIRKSQPVLFFHSMAVYSLDSVAEIIRESFDLSELWTLPSANDFLSAQSVFTRFLGDSFELITTDGIVSCLNSNAKHEPYVLLVAKVREITHTELHSKFVVEPTNIFEVKKS